LKLNFTILFVLSLLLFSCSQPTESKSETQNDVLSTNALPKAGKKLPSITIAILEKLFNECNYVDYLFYDSNFSMSITNVGSIRQTLAHIAEQTPTINPNCKPIGRVFYEIQGNTEIEADIFLNNQCQYYIFYKDNKQIYANNLTADGVAHYNSIFQQARKMDKKQ
jgi:hypothetical protein